MNGQTSFTLTRQGALLALIAAAWPLSGYGMTAGRLDFVVGQVTATGGDGKSRTLARGGEISSGDLIQTGADGRVQIRFADGAYMSLQPNTRFKVDDYHYNGKQDGNEKSVFSLLKGGLRTISGSIGKVNRDAYQVKTPVATIGIRGTGYHADVNGGLQVHVTQGAVALKNDGGELVLGAGQTGVVKDFNTAPQLGFQGGGTGGGNGNGGQGGGGGGKQEEKKTEGSPPPANTYVSGDMVQGNGSPVIVPPTPTPMLPSGEGYAFSATNGANYWFIDEPDVKVTMNEAGHMTSFTIDGGEGRFTYGIGTATVVKEFSGSDEYIAWGTWANGVMTYASEFVQLDGGIPLSGNAMFTYVTGAPTPVGSMPNAGTASYSLLGATRVVGSDGALGSVTSANMAVDFGLSRITGMDFTVNVTSGPAPGAKTLYATATDINENVGLYGNRFSGYLSGCSGCVGGGAAYASGFFAGPGAARAGFSFEMLESGPDRYMFGSVALKKH